MQIQLLALTLENFVDVYVNANSRHTQLANSVVGSNAKNFFDVYVNDYKRLSIKIRLRPTTAIISICKLHNSNYRFQLNKKANL